MKRQGLGRCASPRREIVRNRTLFTTEALDTAGPCPLFFLSFCGFCGLPSGDLRHLLATFVGSGGIDRGQSFVNVAISAGLAASTREPGDCFVTAP